MTNIEIPDALTQTLLEQSPTKAVTCVYCGQVMGWYKTVHTKDPKTGGDILAVEMWDNHDLKLFCPDSPDQRHANMTPEQARAAGHIK